MHIYTSLRRTYNPRPIFLTYLKYVYEKRKKKIQNSSQIRLCLCLAGGAQAPEGGGKIIRLRGGRWTQGNSLPDKTGPLHIWTHGDNDSTHRHAKPQAAQIPALRWGSGHGSPLLTKKLFALTPAGTGTVQRPPTECHWVYQPHPRAGPLPTQTPFDFGHFFGLIFFMFWFYSSVLTFGRVFGFALCVCGGVSKR